MKTTKRILAILLCMMMVFAMSLTASAAESYTITINETTDGYTYEAYQVFSGDLSGSTLSNIEWGTGVNDVVLLAELKANGDAFDACTTAADVAAVLAGFKGDSAEAKAFAEAAANNAVGDGVAFTEGTDVYTANVTAAGYYLVLNTAVPDTNAAYTRYILEVVKDVAVNHKGTISTVEKKIVEGDELVDVNEAVLDEEVKYQITGTLPSNIADYNEYFYKFTDTLSAGLTYKNDSIVVKVNGEDVTAYFYRNINNGTIVISIADLLALETEITADTKVVVTYIATLNDNAVIAGAGNPNTVYLTYSNDPNNSGEGAADGAEVPTYPTEETETPANEDKDAPTPGDEEPTGDTTEVKVVTYTTKLTISKTDGDNPLAGASFRLTSPNGYDQTIAAGAATEFVFEELGAGEYTISEVVTPAGYNSIDDITFTVTFDAATKTFAVSNDTVEVKGNVLSTTIENVSGSLLPSTGGIGTTLFYVLGGMIAMAAVVLLVAKKRACNAA